MSAAAACVDTSSKLPHLPDDILSGIFEQLSGKDRRSFMHTCKALHSNRACLSKISCITLIVDAGMSPDDLHSQLSTIIPGCTISKMVINGYTYTVYPDTDSERSDDPEEDAVEWPGPVGDLIVATFPHHRQLLSRIAHLKLDDRCSLEGFAQETVECLNNCLPNLAHLHVEVFPDSVCVAFLSALQLPLRSLHLFRRGFDGFDTLSPEACASLCTISTLQHLTLGVSIRSFRELSALINLTSLHVPRVYQHNSLGDYSLGDYAHLSSLLAKCPKLTRLELCEPCYISSWPPRSSSVRDLRIEGCCQLDLLPILRMLPSLSHLEVDHVKCYPGESKVAEVANNLQDLAGVSFRCGVFTITSSGQAMRSCEGLLPVLSGTKCLRDAVHDLRLHGIRLHPQQLAGFAQTCPSVQVIYFDRSSFAPESLIECVEAFSKLEQMVIWLREEQCAHDAMERTCKGILDACCAMHRIQGERGHQLTVWFGKGSQNTQQIQVMHRVLDEWQNRQPVGSVGKVKLKAL